MAIVDWLDAWVDTKSVDIADSTYFEHSWPVSDCGFVKAITKDFVILCLSYTPANSDIDADASFKTCAHIPRKMVTKITYLEEVE